MSGDADMGSDATGFNFLSHGSQDLYPTYLTNAKLFTDHNATVATIIGNCVSTTHGRGFEHIG